MIEVIEKILNTSGGDGDFSEGGIPMTPDSDEIDRLFEAWSGERGGHIECLLLLGRVRRLFSRMMAAGRLTDPDEREVKSLLRLIDSIGKDGPAIEG